MNERKETSAKGGTGIRQNYKYGRKAFPGQTRSRRSAPITWKSPTCAWISTPPTHFHLPLQWRAKDPLPSNSFMPAKPRPPPLSCLGNALVLFLPLSLPFFHFWLMPRKLPWWIFMLHLAALILTHRESHEKRCFHSVTLPFRLKTANSNWK